MLRKVVFDAARRLVPMFGVRALVAWALAVTFAAPLVSAGHGAQRTQPPPTFRAEVNHVEVDVTVTGAGDEFVRNLGRDDFEVLEDGKAQDVSTFGLVDLPYEVRSAAPALSSTRIEPDVRSNAAVPEGRVFVIVLDDLHTSPLRSARVKEAARQFTERYVGAHDLVSIIYTSGRSGASQEFTPSSTLLLASIDKFMGRKVRSALLERLDQYRRQDDRKTQADIRLQHIADPLEAERARQAESLLETLERLGDLLGSTRGRRKSVVLISEGIDYDIHNAVRQTTSGLSTFTSSYAQAIVDRLRRAIGAMTRANVIVYGIDPRGIATTGDDMIEVGSFPENPLMGLTASALQDELRRAQESLRVLSEETGGFAATSSNDFSSAFERIVRQNSTYYVLGYRSNNTRADGRFRQIDVRVKRPGVRVRARKGYLAPSSRETRSATMSPRAEPADVLRQTLNNPLPLGGVPLRAFAAPFKGPGVTGSVLLGLEMDARNFRFGQEGGFYTDTVDAAVVAVDAEGRFLDGDRHSVALRLKPETYEAVRAKGLRLMFRLNLAPGRYQLRAGAHETGSAAVGSVHYDIEVPDFNQAPLSLSGVVLTSTSAAATPTPRPDPELDALLRAPPAVTRDFARTDTLAALFALYHDAKEPVGTVDVAITVAADDGQVRFSSDLQITEDNLRKAPHGYGSIVQVPLAGLVPGEYVLRVQARSRTADGLIVVRNLPFQVQSAEAAAR
ncbi:MAG: VWA domain-containing protein [Vicinamibacterales bacterium]